MRKNCSIVIGVIVKNVDSFQDWKHRNGFKEFKQFDTLKQFIHNGWQYVAITRIQDICSMTFNSIIVTKECEGDESYSEIIKAIRPTLGKDGKIMSEIGDGKESIFDQIPEMTADEKLLWENDWIVECQSPFEIRHKDGGAFASGFAAQIVRDSYKEELEADKPKYTIVYIIKASKTFNAHVEYSLDAMLNWLNDFNIKNNIKVVDIIKE